MLGAGLQEVTGGSYVVRVPVAGTVHKKTEWVPLIVMSDRKEMGRDRVAASLARTAREACRTGR